MVFIEDYLVLWIISNVTPRYMEVGSKLCKSAAELFRPVEPCPTGDEVTPTAMAYAGISVVPLSLM